MAIHIPLSQIEEDIKAIIPTDLTVTQIDETYEKMKKRGKIMPGYTPDPIESKIICFNVDDDQNLWVPYHYARTKFKKIPHPDTYVPLPESIELKVELRADQLEDTRKCFDLLVSKGSATVGLPPGRGKTYIGCFLTHCLRLKGMTIVPRKTLCSQWETTFNTGMPDATVWIVDESGRIPERFGGPEITDSSDLSLMPDMIICLDPRISKVPKQWLAKIGTLIIDEAHMLPTRGRIDNLLSIQPCYVLMETATMERGDGLHKICQLIGGSHGVFETSQLPYRFNIVDLPFIEAPERSGFRGIDYNFVCNGLSQMEEYNRAILNIVRHNPDNKFIVLTKRVEHGNSLKDRFIKADISCDTLMGTKKKYTNSRVLIGTFSKIGTGFDEATASDEFKGPTSDSLIICHSVSKIPNFEQYRGRVMRHKNPTVYWLNVKNRVIRNHLTAIKKHVIATNGTICKQEGIQYMYSKPRDK